MSLTNAGYNHPDADFWSEKLFDVVGPVAIPFVRVYRRSNEFGILNIVTDDFDSNGGAYATTGTTVFLEERLLQTNFDAIGASETRTYTAGTIHGISIQVVAETADVNGVEYATGSIINIEGMSGFNNLATTIVIDNIPASGIVNIITLVYV